MFDDRGHPDRAQIARFLWGETSRGENRTVVRHLLRGCSECREAAGATWRQTEPAPPAFPEQAISNRS
jgi:hypothetical protein